MIAVRESRRAGLLQAAPWPRSRAPRVVAVLVALPLAVAYAIASGVEPEQGIYPSIVAVVLLVIFAYCGWVLRQTHTDPRVLILRMGVSILHRHRGASSAGRGRAGIAETAHSGDGG